MAATPHERNVEREIARLRRDVEFLKRRPGFSFPVIRLRRDGGLPSLNVPDGSSVEIPWDVVENRDPCVFTTLEPNEGTFEHRNASFGTDPPITHVRLCQWGAYAQSVVLIWETNWDGEHGVRWETSGSTSWPNVWHQVSPKVNDLTFNNQEPFSHTLWFGSHPDNPNEAPSISANAMQRSGGTKALGSFECFWEIIYLGPIML